ncbi:hypothetical protein IWX49DRAFT_556897 [Phyllosticta citricarpa]|uniref:Uncharacterized protein n=2 Tax=Phyllosticta TaxID=121621 RepID=A0ABR1LJ09_9PEZI
MALLKMPNLRSFVGPVDCSGTLKMAIPRSFQSDRETFAFVEFTGYVKGISGPRWHYYRAHERYQLFFLMRLFGWRISFGKRLETIKVDFDCRLKDMSTDLKKIGWTKEDSQSDSLCFHGGEQYALFLDSVSRAKDVGISVYHGIDRSGIESGFLSGRDQELLCKAEQARNMDMRIISGIESAELCDIRRWWNEDLDIANYRIGLDMTIPKWQDLQSLRLSGIEALATSMVHLLDSHVARLRELHLNKIALNRSKDEREAVWWTIFKLIRKRTTVRNLQTVHFSNLRQHFGYVKRPPEPSHDPDFQRFINSDEFDLEYFSDGFVRRSEAYRLEVQQKIYDFILHRTDELPIEQDDWDFALAHVETCDANQNA